MRIATITSASAHPDQERGSPIWIHSPLLRSIFSAEQLRLRPQVYRQLEDLNFH